MSVYSGALKMAEGNRSARSFGRKENPTIAFNPESELKAIERRRKADLRAERALSRTRNASSAPVPTPTSLDGEPSKSKPKSRTRHYLVAGLACAIVVVTAVGLVPHWVTSVLP
jgi:ferric-dicitrate binding protein FerR (iron transport regulator)